MKQYQKNTMFEVHRIGIVLCIRDDQTGFYDIQKELDLTAGNLVSHLRALEKEKLIRVVKKFKGRRPRTDYYLTKKGENLFESIREWVKTWA